MKNRNKQTKFPVVRPPESHRSPQVTVLPQARIKRIMQKDEEVGKVAQATPVVICCVVPAGILKFLSSY
jgi:hypothetical protein